MQSQSETKKKQYKLAAGLIVGFVVILIFGMWISNPDKNKPDPRQVAIQKAQEVNKSYQGSPTGAVTPEDEWIAKSEQQLNGLDTNSRNFQAEMNSMKQEIKNLKQQVRDSKSGIANGTQIASTSSLSKSKVNYSPAFKSSDSLPPPPEPNSSSTKINNDAHKIVRHLGKNVLPPANPSVARQNAQNGQNGQGSAIEVVSLDQSSSVDGKKKKVIHNIRDSIPPGSFSTVVLLSGLDAPTGGQAQTNPSPVLFRVMDLGQLPNFFHSDIKDCFVIGAGYGDISSERAKFRTEKLSCVLVNGDIVDANIKGFITGEDGKEGMKGRLVEKTGSLLAKTFLAGTLAGIGKVTEQSYQSVSQSALGTVSTITPGKAAKAGVANGAATAFEKLADYYMARANEIYPVIEIDANRIGELVLLNRVDLGKDVIGKMGTEDNEGN